MPFFDYQSTGERVSNACTRQLEARESGQTTDKGYTVRPYSTGRKRLSRHVRFRSLPEKPITTILHGNATGVASDTDRNSGNEMDEAPAAFELSVFQERRVIRIFSLKNGKDSTISFLNQKEIIDFQQIL